MNHFKTFAPSVRIVLFGAALLAFFSVSASALTVDQPVSVTFVRDHPEEWSVKVSKKENGLIQFTIVRFLKEPKYLVAHFVVNHSTKVIAESDSPAFGRKGVNTFYCSLSLEDLAESKFDLSESVMAGSGDDAVPIPGTIVHQFRLRDFIPEEIPKSPPNK